MAKPKILENISTIQNSGFTNRAKQAEVTSYKELGNGRWFGELTDAPESGVFFYNVFKGDNDNYKYVEAMSWINDKIFISKCINGEWSAWEDRKSVLESKINVLDEKTIQKTDIEGYRNKIIEIGTLTKYRTILKIIFSMSDWYLSTAFNFFSVSLSHDGTDEACNLYADYIRMGNETSNGDGRIVITKVKGIGYKIYLYVPDYSDFNSYTVLTNYGAVLNEEIKVVENIEGDIHYDSRDKRKIVATTDKTEILLTPPSGFSVADNFSNKCFIDGVGNIHLNFCWKKTDSSDITGLIVANLPTSISPTYRTIGYMTQWNNSNDYDYQIGMCYVDNVSNGRLVCHVAKQCKIISGYICFRRE